MFDRLRARLGGEGALVAGVLSGTSADGIDVALARLALERGATPARLARPELLAFETRPFEPALAARLRRVLDLAPIGLGETALLHRDLGRAFGAAARDVARAHGLALELVGSHGQTVWHHDGAEPSGAATLQLGDGDHVAELAGAPVVSDFRQRDIAAGGEGAPLSALVDDDVFAAAARPCAVLNLGGLANLTVLGERGAPPRAAFDTGPANSLLDGLARLLFDLPYDADGARALRGRPDAVWVAEQLAAPFFERAPPKSTGRDSFGAPWVAALVERERARGRLSGEQERCDLLASGVELVARSVALALERFVPDTPRELLLAGGGGHNAALVAALARHTRLACRPSDVVGVPTDAREGLVFALLAARAVLDLPSSAPAATGARAGRVLGKFSPHHK